MTLLQAFTDDSAAQTGDRRLFLAGYLHHADVWASFSGRWQAELEAWPAIDYFKASEANSLSGQFDSSRGWDAAKRDTKVALLAEIISNYRPFSFEFSINRKIFEEELKAVSPYGLGRPHFQMCFAVVAGVARYVAEGKIDTPIEFVFDEQQGVDGDIDLFFSHLTKALPVEAQALIAGKPIFKSDRDKRYLPLQAADLLAWYVRREFETGKKLPITNKLLNPDGHLTQEIPDEMVRMWADHHSQLPGTPLLQSAGKWRQLKKEIQRLQKAGIDPSKITRAGVYYPEGTPMLARIIDRVRRFFKPTPRGGPRPNARNRQTP